MRDVTDAERIAFFQAMKQNNLSYRENPRTKEEVAELIVVYNSDKKHYYTLKKGTELSKDEKEVGPYEIFAHIVKDLDVVFSEVETSDNNHSM